MAAAARWRWLSSWSDDRDGQRNHDVPRTKKREYLPALATGRYVGAYCLSEPSSGSDAKNMPTQAVRDGDDYVLNGTKSWITNGGEAGLYLVYALSDPGITAFLVPADTA